MSSARAGFLCLAAVFVRLEAEFHTFDSLVLKVDVWFPLSDDEYEIVSCCLPPALLERIQKKGSRMAWNGQIYEATRPKM